jgi:hypothetical protein
MSETCTYTRKNSDGYGTLWTTSCGRKHYIEAPIEVGMSFAPLPNKDGKYCHYCGKQIKVLGNNK